MSPLQLTDSAERRPQGGAREPLSTGSGSQCAPPGGQIPSFTEKVEQSTGAAGWWTFAAVGGREIRQKCPRKRRQGPVGEHSASRVVD